MIDVAGDGFVFTSPQNGVRFDLLGNGVIEQWSWPTADDGWLVLDRNHNGTIDNGKELFGSSTDQPTCDDDVPNGFLALAQFDKPENGGNGDGFIDSSDSIFADLRLWQDKNQDGVSQLEELSTLPQLGIVRIDLAYKKNKKTDQYGNVFGYRARVWDAKGEQAGRWAYDVFLQKAQ